MNSQDHIAANVRYLHEMYGSRYRNPPTNEKPTVVRSLTEEYSPDGTYRVEIRGGWDEMRWFNEHRPPWYNEAV
jgi:hypothetical protein